VTVLVPVGESRFVGVLMGVDVVAVAVFVLVPGVLVGVV
jgi:hypothetical protein